MQRWYLDSRWTYYGDRTSDSIKKFIKECGAKNVRTACKFGWSNLPKVLTFSTNDMYVVRDIEDGIGNMFVVCKHWKDR